MGNLSCEDPRVISLIDDMRSKSSVLDLMLKQILSAGDLVIHLTRDLYSCYDKRNIWIGLGVGRGEEMSIASELVIEICNAWYDFKRLKPNKAFYNTAEEYAVAVERQEWCSVKKHVTVYRQLTAQDAKFEQGNRFKYSFFQEHDNWNDFDNYLKYQKSTGHTEKVASYF